MNANLIPSQPQYIPMIKVRPDCAVGYYQYCGPKRKAWQGNLFMKVEGDRESSQPKEVNRAYLGEMSQSAIRKMKAACEILFALARKKKVTSPKTGKEFSFKIALITLTLSAPQSEYTDREIKKELLEPFLRRFRARGMYNYIWKAERQANGNLHFHILTDSYQDMQDVKDYWNKLQAKLGLIETFYKKYGHRNPNSTDVKAVKSDKGMVNYMLKYMLKPAEKGKQLELGRKVEKGSIGKIWDCSLNLKLKNETAEVVEDWQFELMEKAVDDNRLKLVQCDNCVVYLPVKGKIWNVAPAFLQKRLLDFLKEVRRKGKESARKEAESQ